MYITTTAQVICPLNGRQQEVFRSQTSVRPATHTNEETLVTIQTWFKYIWLYCLITRKFFTCQTRKYYSYEQNFTVIGPVLLYFELHNFHHISNPIKHCKSDMHWLVYESEHTQPWLLKMMWYVYFNVAFFWICNFIFWCWLLQLYYALQNWTNTVAI